MAVKRRMKLASQAKQKTTRKHDSAGGLYAVTGYTADVAGLTDLVSMKKGVFGLFENGNPNYHVVYGDILTSEGIRVLEPLYAYSDLLRLYNSSTILRQCVDSYVTNIESYGVKLEYIGPEGQQTSRAATNEKARIERILSTITSDGRPIQKHREDSRADKEILGARCFEVIRDAVGRVVGFDHVPTVTMRQTSREKNFTEYEAVDPVTGTYKTVRRRFRRYIQVDEFGNKTWFKELGDPRPIDPKTGKVNNELSIEDEATEIYYEGLYCPGTPSGVPRWAGAIPALLGAREAEMVNLNFFRDNAIPAMAVLVSGGALTEESFDKIDQYIAGVRGAASMNRIVVMEATSDMSEAASIDGSISAPKIDIKPMLSDRQHEGLFASYIDESERKARSTFRLPPLYIGSASEYNRASAFASVLTADQQIFTPERMAWDTMFDRIVLSSYSLKYWKVRSASPGMQDPAEAARVINSLGREGALTPNVAIKIANRYLDADIEHVSEDWGDIPFSVTMQHLKNSGVVPGLDIIEEINENLSEPVDTSELNSSDAMVPLAKTLQRLLDEVTEKMQEQLDEAYNRLQEAA